MDILIFIPTYNRPDMCLRLLKQIKEQQGDHDITILLVNDRSTKNYKPVREYLANNFHSRSYKDTLRHNGKAHYWETVNMAFFEASISMWELFIMLADDLQLTPNFFNRAIELFSSRRDIICMNLLYEYGRAKTKMWTNVEPQIINDDMMTTGWVDMCFVAERKFLNLLNNTIHEVPASWAADPTRSSGVGMQISKRIVAEGYVFHQVRKSLVIHGDHHSMMHPEERKKHPLISNHETNSPENKTASLAAMPAREKQLQQVIRSLLPQVDRINVYLNEWQHVPDFLSNKKITVFRSQDEAGDLGDVGKFYQCEKVRGYHFTCDDDLLYPADYVETLINAIEKRSRKAVVSFHGRSFDQFPITSYYNGHASAISCMNDCEHDTPAHVVGTGVLGYHTDTLKITLADFKAINMGDIWFSIQAELQNIPRVILKHEDGWIQYLKVPFADTIAGWHHNNEAVQVEAMNTIKWKPLEIQYNLNTLRPDVARKYYVPTIKPGKYNFKGFGDIDLCQLTVEQADRLVERNFPFLIPKKQNIVIPKYQMPLKEREIGNNNQLKRLLKMNIIAVMPIRGRLPLLSVTIKRLLNRNGVTQVICIGESIEEEKVVNDSGGIFVKYKNNPLAEKCNIGFTIARDFKPDGVLFTGSSDWMSDNWIAELGKYMHEYDMVGKLDFYLLDVGNAYRACHWLGYPEGIRFNEPIGIGRIISAKYLDKVHWKPLEEWRNSSLDGSLYKILNKNNGKTKIIKNHNLLSLSISTNRWPNLHNFEKHWEDKQYGKTDRISIKLIDKHFPEYKTIFPNENM